MKRILLIVGMLLMGISTLWAQSETQTKKVAILEVVDRDGMVNYGVKLLLRSTLAKAITQTPGYEGYDRVDMGAILGEQDFQRTGMVSDEQIKRLGEMTGASYVLVAEAAKIDESTVIVTAKIIDVETAKLERTDYEQMSTDAKEMGAACQRMAGRLLKVSTSNVSVNTSGEKKVGKQPDYTSSKTNTNTANIPSERISFTAWGKLTELDNHGFYKKMSQTNTELFLGDLYQEYRKTVTIRNAGIICMAAGGSITAVGGMVWGTGEIGISPIVTIVGMAVLVAGIPMYAVSNKKVKRIIQTAAEQHATPPYKTACTFDFNTRHGVGFNLNF